MQHSPTRFALQSGETLLGRAEVVADTPTLAGAAAMVWVTERRVVLCRVPGRWLALATLAAGVTTVASGQFEGPVCGICVVLFMALLAGRGRLRFRRVMLEAQGGEVVDVARGGENAVGVFLRDGSTWRLRPARHMLAFPGPVSSNLFGRAALALLRLVGRAGWATGQRGVRA